MHANQHKISLLFPISITELYKHAKVPIEDQKDVEITRTSSTYIKKIRAEYIKDQDETKEKEVVSKLHLTDTIEFVRAMLLRRPTATVTPHVQVTQARLYQIQ